MKDNETFLLVGTPDSRPISNEIQKIIENEVGSKGISNLLYNYR